MKKWIAGGIAALLLAFGAWLWASPVLAMSGLRDALIKGDRDELSERVDFPSVRESLKGQMMAMMTAEMAKPENKESGFAAFGAMLAGAMVNQMIDGIVTPDGLKAMVEHGKLKPEAPTAKQPETEWRVERDGLSKFRAVPLVKPGEQAPKMLFKRDGLGWRLVDIELPKDGLRN